MRQEAARLHLCLGLASASVPQLAGREHECQPPEAREQEPPQGHARIGVRRRFVGRFPRWRVKGG